MFGDEPQESDADPELQLFRIVHRVSDRALNFDNVGGLGDMQRRDMNVQFDALAMLDVFVEKNRRAVGRDVLDVAVIQSIRFYECSGMPFDPVAL